MKDYYAILELDHNASDDDIKRNFRRLAKKYHPDVNDDPDCIQKFREVYEAYKILSSSEKIVNYEEDNIYSNVDIFDIIKELDDIINYCDYMEFLLNNIVKIYTKRK